LCHFVIVPHAHHTCHCKCSRFGPLAEKDQTSLSRICTMTCRNEARLSPMGEGGLELGSHFLAWLNKRKWQVTTGLTTTREIINLQIDRGYYSITKELITRLDNDLIDNAFPLANTQTLTRPPSPERGRPWLTEPACGALTPSGRRLFGIIFVFPDPIEAGRVSTCSY
jgi:hypothetical protein